jgi:hypothetical protein
MLIGSGKHVSEDDNRDGHANAGLGKCSDKNSERVEHRSEMCTMKSSERNIRDGTSGNARSKSMPISVSISFLPMRTEGEAFQRTVSVSACISKVDRVHVGGMTPSCALEQGIREGKKKSEKWSGSTKEGQDSTTLSKTQMHQSIRDISCAVATPNSHFQGELLPQIRMCGTVGMTHECEQKVFASRIRGNRT